MAPLPPTRRTVATTFADRSPAIVRVSEHGAADRPRRARPRLESGQASPDRPANEVVQAHAGIGANAGLPLQDDRAAVNPNDDAANPGVAHQDVRAAAEDGRRQACLRRNRDHPCERRGVVNLDEVVRRPAHPERRERRQRRLAPHALGAKLRGEQVEDGGHQSRIQKPEFRIQKRAPPSVSRGCRRSRRSTSAPPGRRHAVRAPAESTMSSTDGT